MNYSFATLLFIFYNYIGEVDFTGEQSSTGTLTPPTTFSPTSTQLDCLAKSKKYTNDKFGEISSDQFGDSSGDDIDVGVESNAITRKMILQVFLTTLISRLYCIVISCYTLMRYTTR